MQYQIKITECANSYFKILSDFFVIGVNIFLFKQLYKNWETLWCKIYGLIVLIKRKTVLIKFKYFIKRAIDGMPSLKLQLDLLG